MKIKRREVFMKGTVTNLFREKDGNTIRLETNAGCIVYVNENDIIPCPPFPKEGEDRGEIMLGGKVFTAADIRIFIDLYEGLLRQNEDLKYAYRRVTSKNGDVQE